MYEASVRRGPATPRSLFLEATCERDQGETIGIEETVLPLCAESTGTGAEKQILLSLYELSDVIPICLNADKSIRKSL